MKYKFSEVKVKPLIEVLGVKECGFKESLLS
jgi:hypothetical protein